MGRVGTILFTILEFFAFALVIVGTPIDVFRKDGESSDSNTECLTMWGYKEKCYSTSLTLKFTSNTFLNCPSRFRLFQCSQACSIITILLFFMNFLLGLVSCCCAGGNCAFTCIIYFFSALAFLTAAAVWIPLSVLFLSGSNDKTSIYDLCEALNRNYIYGIGFFLVLSGWVGHTVGSIFLSFPC